MEIKTTLDNSVANYAKNLRDLALEINYDKASPEAKVTISQFEFIKKEAELLLSKINDGGLGVMFGVPYKIELGEKGEFETILNGIVDLTNAEKFSCREVIAPVIEKGGTDFLTQTADSFTFEYLYYNRPDLLNKTHFKFVPYIRNKPDVSELAPAVLNLITIGIQVTKETSEIIRSIAGLLAFEWEQLFKMLVKSIYVVFLILTLIQALQTILDMILCPIRYHAGMTALELCQIGATYKGYQFSSSILEGEFADMVIVPPKQEAVSANDSLLFTGFSEPDPDLQLGFYQGTFGQLLRDLITMFKGKIIIEDTNGEGSQKIIRLEREDFNPSNELYTMPDADDDGIFTLNTQEFNASRMLRYTTDDLDLNTYQNFELSNIIEVLEPIDKGTSLDYCNLYKGFEETIIPFALGVRRNETPPVEATITSLIVLAELSINNYIENYNIMVQQWANNLGMTDEANSIRQGVAGAAIYSTVPDVYTALIELITNGVDFSRFYIGRNNAMVVERDQIGVHRVAMLEEDYTINLSEAIQEVLENVSQENDFAFNLSEVARSFSQILTTGTIELNVLKEDNNTTLSAENLYTSFHIIESFLPSDERPKGNQWKIPTPATVKFCKKDFDLLKTDNKFKNAAGESCLLESLKWFPFQNKAEIKYRINETYLTNIQLKHGQYIQRTGR